MADSRCRSACSPAWPVCCISPLLFLALGLVVVSRWAAARHGGPRVGRRGSCGGMSSLLSGGVRPRGAARPGCRGSIALAVIIGVIVLAAGTALCGARVASRRRSRGTGAWALLGAPLDGIARQRSTSHRAVGLAEGRRQPQSARRRGLEPPLLGAAGREPRHSPDSASCCWSCTTSMRGATWSSGWCASHSAARCFRRPVPRARAAPRRSTSPAWRAIIWSMCCAAP